MESTLTIRVLKDKLLYDKDDFKIYAVTASDEYTRSVTKPNKYGNFVIVGEMPFLTDGTEYTVKCTEELGKHGINYKVNHISRDVPTTLTQKRNFLKEILTKKQADTLLGAYPEIIQMVVDGRDQTEIDLDKLHGIGEKIYDGIRQKIIKNFVLMVIIDDFIEFGLTLSQLHKLYSKFNSVDLLFEKMASNPYKCLCSVSGIGFTIADKKILNKYPDLLDSEQRCRSAIEYVVLENEFAGHTVIKMNEIKKKLYDIAKETISHFDKALESSEELIVVEDSTLVGSKRLVNAEKYIAEHLLRGLQKSNRLQIDYSKYTHVGDIPLTTPQSELLRYFVKYNIIMLRGYAGTGKSFSTSALMNLLDDNNLRCMLMSPTGKSSKVLSGYTNREVFTVHRALGIIPNVEKLKFDETKPLPYDVILIDEASMIDAHLMFLLLKAIDFSRTRLVLVQDPEQLPSVGAGNVSHDLLVSKEIPTVTLEKVFRYEDGGLAKVATDIRNGKNYILSKTDRKGDIIPYGINRDYILVNCKDTFGISKILKMYERLIQNGVSIDEIMVLSAYNKTKYGILAINNYIQTLVNPASCSKSELPHRYKDVDMVFREGDKVMQIKNNYKALTTELLEIQVFNGNTGVVKYINEKDKSMVVTINGSDVLYTENELKLLILGYAMTIHKSQGSSAKYIILFTPTAQKYFLTRNLLYVGVTRARYKVIHIGQIQTIVHALGKADNLSRRTVLGLFIKKIKQILLEEG